MLLRHSALYFLARGVPGILSFLGIAVYTRLLPPEEYGRYTLVVAGVSFFNVMFFQWLRLSLLRFLPAYKEDENSLLLTIRSAFVALVAMTGVIGVTAAFAWPDVNFRPLILLGVFLLWAQAWFELNLELYRGRMQVGQYGMISGLRAVVALGVGAGLVLLGLGARGPLVGLLVAMGMAGLVGTRRNWFHGSFRKGFSWTRIKPLLVYGLPFVGNFALGFVVSSSDRFMLAAFLGEGAAGVYAAGYDLVWQTLGLLAATINLAAYPLAVRAYESGNRDEARDQLQSNFGLLVGVTLPATVGISLLAKPIAAVVLGVGFQDVASVLPLVAFANLLFNFKVYHADLAYQLAKQTHYQIRIAALTATVNVILNFWLIPLAGPSGAAYATAGAYLTAVLMSFRLGRSLMPIPVLFDDVKKVVVATAFMGAVLFLTANFVWARSTLLSLVLTSVGGIVIYLLALGLMDGLRVRTLLVQNLSFRNGERNR